MSITTLDGVITALASAQKRDIFKTTATAEGAGTGHSLWKLTGIPTAGSNPPAYTAGSGYVPTSATTGAVAFTDPGGSNTAYVGQALFSSSVIGKMVLYDRLWACSGFGTVSTSLQSITTPGNLTRPDALGAGVELWLEVYSAPGSTGATWTIIYDDQGNNSSTTTYTHPANAETAGQMMPVVLASGDTGVRRPTSFQASISSGTAGDIGITLLRRIAEVPVLLAGGGVALDFASLGMPKITSGACLAMLVMCSATTTGNWQGVFNFIEG